MALAFRELCYKCQNKTKLWPYKSHEYLDENFLLYHPGKSYMVANDSYFGDINFKVLRMQKIYC